MEAGTIIDSERLASELLVQFMDDLREAGYNIGIQQYIAVQDLLLTLTAQGELHDVRKLKSFIGPIVCSSAIEQIDFQDRFEAWSKQFKLANYRPPASAEAITEKLVEDLERIQKGGKIVTKFLTFVVVISAVLLVTSLRLQKDTSTSYSTNTPPQKPTSTVPLPSPSSEEPSPSPSSEEPSPSSSEAPPLPSSMRDNKGSQWRELLFFGIVLVALIFWRFWWYHNARQFLNRRESNQSPELQKISIQGIESSLFSSNLIFQTAQLLRRRTQQLVTKLDIQKTIEASLNQGGWFTPIYGTKKVIPEYLFLIDRASYADHQAKLTEELIQQLQRNGVYINRYFFDGDAQVCYPELQRNFPQSLQDLFNKYGSDRLVIVAEAETLFSHQTGEPEPWLERMQAWEQRVILTPTPVESWSQWEFKLVQQFIMLPLTPQGITVFPQIFLKDSTVYRLAEASPTPFPGMLGIRSRRWLERNPPRADEGKLMLANLSDYLGQSGCYWFAACAVFPELHWTITVYLGNVLKDTEGCSLLSGPTLSKLVRLPWFRYGYIPDWLRRYLVLNLTPDQNKTVRQAFRKLMVMAVRGGIGPLQLELAQQYQQALPNLTRPLLQLLSRQARDEAPLRDYIFLDFMAKESLLTVAIPENLKPLLQGSQYEKVLHRQQRRLIIVFSFIFVIVGFIFFEVDLYSSLMPPTHFLYLENRLSDNNKTFIQKSLKKRHFNRPKIRIWLIIPVLILLAVVIENNIRENSIKQDFALLNETVTYREKQAVEDLVKGCREQNGISSYFGEHLYGNCRSLSGANLHSADLSSANLFSADLSSANLFSADLSSANLSSANLFSANLSSANLSSTNLSSANLISTDLSSADFFSANLSSANLFSADLNSANLNSANLFSANLHSANLFSANLFSANLSSADLSLAILLSTDFRESKNLIQSQLEGAKYPLICNSPLPENINIDSNRDCDKVAAALRERFSKAFPSLEKAEEYVQGQRQKKWD